MSSSAPRLAPDLPELPEFSGLDDRLVVPESRYEMVDGELVHVSPAKAAHAQRHAQVIALLEAHVARTFDVAADLLTQTSPVDDIAPDVSVYADRPDPRTGDYLDRLAFEVVSTQSLGDAAVKAAKLAGRGIRRVFAIDVPRSRALEWSVARAAWIELDPVGQIVDPALEVPLPIEALIYAANTKDTVARALVAQRNPVFEAVRTQDRATSKAEGLAEGKAEGLAEGKAEGLAEGKAEGLAEGKAEGLAEGKAEGLAKGKAEGKAEGKVEALLAILAARAMEIDDATHRRLLEERDLGRLDRWIIRAAFGTSIAEVLTDD